MGLLANVLSNDPQALRLQGLTQEMVNSSFWPEMQQVINGPGGWRAVGQMGDQNYWSKYPDYDAAKFKDVIGPAIANEEDTTGNLFGVNIHQSTKDKLGDTAGGLATLGMLAGAGYVGGSLLGAEAAGGAAGATDASTGLYAGESANAGAGAYGATGGGATGAGTAASSPMLLADAGNTMTDVGPGYGQATTAGTTGGEPVDIFGSTAQTPGYSTDPGVWNPDANYVPQSNWQTGNWWDKYLDPKYAQYAKTLSDLIGKAAPAALGAYGANQQSNAYGDLANKYLAIGAPSRARYEASYAPGFTMANDPGYTDALNQTTKATLHGLSVNGNPAGSPNAWEKTLSDVNAKFAYPALQDFRRVNAGTGGLAALTSAAPGADAASVNAGRGVYDALGAGAADVFNPPRSLSDLLREMKRAGY